MTEGLARGLRRCFLVAMRPQPSAANAQADSIACRIPSSTCRASVELTSGPRPDLARAPAAARLPHALPRRLDERDRRRAQLHRADVARARRGRRARRRRGAAGRQPARVRLRPARRDRGRPLEPAQADDRRRRRARGDADPARDRRPRRRSCRCGRSSSAAFVLEARDELLRAGLRRDDPGRRRPRERAAGERARARDGAGALGRRLGGRGAAAPVHPGQHVLRRRRGDVPRLGRAAHAPRRRPRPCGRGRVDAACATASTRCARGARSRSR